MSIQLVSRAICDQPRSAGHTDDISSTLGLIETSESGCYKSQSAHQGFDTQSKEVD